jgi:hypothetical protein
LAFLYQLFANYCDSNSFKDLNFKLLDNSIHCKDFTALSAKISTFTFNLSMALFAEEKVREKVAKQFRVTLPIQFLNNFEDG